MLWALSLISVNIWTKKKKYDSHLNECREGNVFLWRQNSYKAVAAAVNTTVSQSFGLINSQNIPIPITESQHTGHYRGWLALPLLERPILFNHSMLIWSHCWVWFPAQQCDWTSMFAGKCSDKIGAIKAPRDKYKGWSLKNQFCMDLNEKRCLT